MDRERRSPLTNLNGLPPATQLLYKDIPKYYTWRTDPTWYRRVRPKKSDCVGRMFAAHPREGERYYLRLLLLCRKDVASFEDLKRVDTKVRGRFIYEFEFCCVQMCSSFREACAELLLLDDDQEWYRCMHEAAESNMPYQLRNLFVTILCSCGVQDIRTFFDTFCHSMAEDYTREAKISLR